MSQVECPYCEHVFEPDSSDGFEQGLTYDEECESCGKFFILTSDYEIVFKSQKAACLNGGGHDFTQWYCIKRDSESSVYARHCLACGKTERKTE